MLGFAVWETNWQRVSEKIKAKAEKKTSPLSNKIKRKHIKIKPTLKIKLFFYIMRMIQKKGINKLDKKYWYEKGWLAEVRPWK